VAKPSRSSLVFSQGSNFPWSTFQAAAAGHSRAPLAGFTLVESLASIALAGLALLAILAVFLYNSRSCAAIVNYVDLDRQSQIALDRLSQQIRQVRRLTYSNSTNLTFLDFDGQKLAFNYDSTRRTLTRLKANESTVFLNNLDSLEFLTYQHALQAGTFDTSSSSSVTNCKVVEINWSCSRELLGKKANTESLRSAKVVIRNK